MLQEASPNLFFPTAVAWEELKTALSDLNFSRIRSDLQVVDGFEVSWDIKWDGIKSGGTVVNPRGEEFEILQAAFGAFTVSDNFPRGVTIFLKSPTERSQRAVSAHIMTTFIGY